MTSGSEYQSPGRSGDAFACEVSLVDDAARVRLSGELDLATAPTADARLRELVSEGARTLVLDLRGLSFIDSSGLSLFLAWARTTREAGIGYSLIPGAPSVQRVFAIAGVEALLPFVGPVAAEESVASGEVSRE
jgi:anti-sigma B factor antagonist